MCVLMKVLLNEEEKQKKKNDEFIRYIYLFIKTWIEKNDLFVYFNDRYCSDEQNKESFQLN